MAMVVVTADIDLSARTVWDMVGDFAAIAKWRPLVESCSISFKDATQRHLIMVDGATFIEQFEGADYGARAHHYSIVEGPLPVEGYRGSMRVLDRQRGKAARVEWSSKFTVSADEEAVVERIAAFYESGLEGLRSRLAAADRATKRKADRRAARAAKAKKPAAKSARTGEAPPKKQAASGYGKA